MSNDIILKIDGYIIDEANFASYKNILVDVFDKVFRKNNIKSVQAEFLDKLKKFTKITKEIGIEKDVINIINKNLKTNFSNLNDLSKYKIETVVDENVNEDFKHFYQTLKNQFIPTLTIFSGLQMFFELDKLIKPDVSPDWRVFLSYVIIWAIVVTGIFIKGWFDWKKTDKEEWEREGGHKNPFTTKGNLKKILNKKIF